jgi:uncharacterized coiled-coil protein SlyX
MSTTTHRAPRLGVLGLLTLAAAGALLATWAGPARATDSTRAQLCVTREGQVRVAASCRTPAETPLVLATATGLDAATARIATLERRVASLEEQLAQARVTIEDQATALQKIGEDLTALEHRTERDSTSLWSHVGSFQHLLRGVTRERVDGRDTLRLSGMNLQVVNGTGTTDGAPNGLGNVVIGYSAPPKQQSKPSERTGSHYLVVGDGHSWTRFGGLVAGLENQALGDHASVLGGHQNTATGLTSVVGGGFNNTVAGEHAAVGGGVSNVAAGPSAFVAGGVTNTASGPYDVVVGGYGNLSNFMLATVVGGEHNRATGHHSVVAGGRYNEASGYASSVFGGARRREAGDSY